MQREGDRLAERIPDGAQRIACALGGKSLTSGQFADFLRRARDENRDIAFLIGGAYLLASGGHLTVNAGWTLSLLALGLGLSGIVGAILRSRRGDDDWRD